MGSNCVQPFTSNTQVKYIFAVIYRRSSAVASFTLLPKQNFTRACKILCASQDYHVSMSLKWLQQCFYTGYSTCQTVHTNSRFLIWSPYENLMQKVLDRSIKKSDIYGRHVGSCGNIHHSKVVEMVHWSNRAVTVVSSIHLLISNMTIFGPADSPGYEQGHMPRADNLCWSIHSDNMFLVTAELCFLHHFVLSPLSFCPVWLIQPVTLLWQC